MLSKRERLEIIFNRLRDANPVSCRDKANELICNIVNEVEDEETELPLDYNAESGRMFFYSFDLGFWENLSSDPAKLDLNRKHCIELYRNGDIVIFERRNNVVTEVFRKDGI